MKWRAILRSAVRALGRNRLRSALTMLGIVIGVGAVIAMVSLGQGAEVMVQDQIASIGTNIMFVTPGSLTSGGVRLGAGAASTLTVEDSESIARECPAVAAASPAVRTAQQMVFGDQNWFTQVQGTNEMFPLIRDWPIQQGAFFTSTDVRSSARVVVLGATAVSKLLPGGDPVGQTIRIGKLPFRVVGVLASKGQSLMGQDQDDLAVMPYSTVQKKLLGQKIPSVNQIMVSSISPNASDLAVREITALLRQRHRIPASQPDDFTIHNLTDIANAAQRTNTIMTLLLGSIAAVSLVVGGIGIMNIMLVSVTERTREIGVSMAVGARPGYVRGQFLTESVMLSLLGGLLGVVVGSALAVTIAHALGWPTDVSVLSVLVSFGFAASVGVFFGYYPAHKAASMDPIEALRYE
jgi:putative ABC transport system permease protein